jgi:hypothetical protein
MMCGRVATCALDPDQPASRSTDGAFRLGNALSAAITDAHRAGVEFGELAADQLLSGSPPPELGDEEAGRFRLACDIYVEAFDDLATKQLHANLLDPRRTLEIGSYGVALTGAVSLAFSADPDSPHGSSVDLRSVVFGSLSAPNDHTRDLLRLAVLGARDGIATRLAIDPVTKEYRMHEHACSGSAIRDTVAKVGNALDAAYELVAEHRSGAAVPSWLCTTCSYVRDCPAIPDVRFADVIERYPS